MTFRVEPVMLSNSSQHAAMRMLSSLYQKTHKFSSAFYLYRFPLIYLKNTSQQYAQEALKFRRKSKSRSLDCLIKSKNSWAENQKRTIFCKETPEFRLGIRKTKMICSKSRLITWSLDRSWWESFTLLSLLSISSIFLSCMETSCLAVLK